MMRKSIPMIVVLFTFILMNLCIFGCMAWFAGRGQWYPPESTELIELRIGGRNGDQQDTSIRQDGIQLFASLVQVAASNFKVSQIMDRLKTIVEPEGRR